MSEEGQPRRQNFYGLRDPEAFARLGISELMLYVLVQVESREGRWRPLAVVGVLYSIVSSVFS